METPPPDVLVTSVGTRIHYGVRQVEDTRWQLDLGYRWRPDEVHKVLDGVPGLELQPPETQTPYKISYFVDTARAPPLAEMTRRLRRHNVHVRRVFSHQAFLDVLPVRASKGHALRYLAIKWGLPWDRILVAGGSGNDEEMLCGDTLGVVVGNYSPELERLRGRPRIYFARASHAWGILEGMEHYNFLQTGSELAAETR